MNNGDLFAIVGSCILIGCACNSLTSCFCCNLYRFKDSIGHLMLKSRIDILTGLSKDHNIYIREPSQILYEGFCLPYSRIQFFAKVDREKPVPFKYRCCSFRIILPLRFPPTLGVSIYVQIISTPAFNNALYMF